MSDKTEIQWTDSTWNPVTGCTKVSPGCHRRLLLHRADAGLPHQPPEV